MFFFSFCFCFVISIDENEFDLQDFYSKYSKAEWDGANERQKQSIIEDYVKRESAAIEAIGLGYIYDPVVINRFENIKKQLLVNLYYDKYVAFPLVDSIDFVLTKKHLKKEVNVKHLLISHNQSELSNSNSRSKKEAVKLVNDIRETLILDPSLFDSLAFNFSDDPSVKKNGGRLGWLMWGRTPMSFQSSVWSSDTGVVTSAIETQYGYHLAVVEEERLSEFSFYDESSYNYEAIRRSLVLVRDKLRGASELFEKNVFFNGDIKLFGGSFELLYDSLLLYRSELLDGERFVLVDFLSSLEDRFVLCSINNSYMGVRSFLPEIKRQPPPKGNDFNSEENLVAYFKMLMLRKYVEEKALSVSLDDFVFFKKRYKTERAKFLYDFYFKTLVNAVSVPDSSSVEDYYLEHKNKKYSTNERVIVRQIRIKNKVLADSLKGVVNSNNFASLATTFSINRKDVGGLMEAFERGKYNNMGDVAFSLALGEVSEVIENPDKTFSIILLENKLPSEAIPIKRVYKRIESLLLKKSQENIKTITFEKYLNSKNLKLGEKYEKYIN